MKKKAAKPKTRTSWWVLYQNPNTDPRIYGPFETKCDAIEFCYGDSFATVIQARETVIEKEPKR